MIFFCDFVYKKRKILEREDRLNKLYIINALTKLKSEKG